MKQRSIISASASVYLTRDLSTPTAMGVDANPYARENPVDQAAAAHQATPTKRFTKKDQLALLFIALWFLSDTVFFLTPFILGPAVFLQIVLGFYIARLVFLLLFAILYAKWSSAGTRSR